MKEEVFFHLTGRRLGPRVEPVDELALRPALFARFHDLTRLRYDFPLVLVDGNEDEPFVPLSRLIDAMLRDIAPRGIAGERMRRSALRLEREIRVMLREGETGSLSRLWDRATDRLVAMGGEPVASDLGRARAALRIDGTIVDCDAKAAARFVTHAWRVVQARRATAMRREIDALSAKLAGLVRADFLRSETGRRRDPLEAGVGPPHRELFDFELMARLLAKPSGPSALPQSRLRRIDEALAVLRSQRFFNGESSYSFAFGRVHAALAAFRERLPAAAALVKAMAIAELELEGRYVEATHDGYFASFDERALGPEELLLLPDYLVCLDPNDAGGRSELIEAVTSGAPLKVLVATDDVFGPGAQLATTAMGLGETFVLQATSANLYRARASVLAALNYRGPALLSVFAAPYLVSAAALESRAFPTFSYNPSAGVDWAHRFSLDGNPRPEGVWPVHELDYADEGLQRVREGIPFTFADFALCDPRRSGHFALVPRERWNGGLVPLGEWLGSRGAPDAVPYIYGIDAEQRLRKLVVDNRLAHAARHCADAWLRLRELDELKREHAAALTQTIATAPAVEADAVVAAEPAHEERTSDEPYIETPRCTSCNECTQINNRMFAYNENKQAYVADPAAGTYRQLVEAAESCQVAIVHPGKPRNPNEPGLEELLQRAGSFR